MALITVDNDGIMCVTLDNSLPDESFTLASPNLTQWQVSVFSDGQAMTVTDLGGPFPAATRQVYTSPSGTVWELLVDDNGILRLTSFNSALIISPVGNHQFKKSDGTLAAGYLLFISDLGINNEQDTYGNGSFLFLQPNPITLNSLGFSPVPIFIEVGKVYTFQLAPPGETFPPNIIEDQWIGVSAGPDFNRGNITEWVEPPIECVVTGNFTLRVPGDQRRTFLVGRRVRDAQGGGGQ